MFELLAIPRFALTEMLVSKEPKPNADPVVLIKGRKTGLISWLLTLLKLEPTCSLSVSEKEIMIEQTSLFGATHEVVPINRVASASFGVLRPLLALPLAALFGMASIGLLIGGMIIGMAITLIIAIAFFVDYLVGKSAVIFIESTGGRMRALAFKGALIGGKRVDMKKAQDAVFVIRDMILESEKPFNTVVPDPGLPAEPLQSDAIEKAGLSTFIFKCSSCQYQKDVPLSYAGKRAKCPRCKNVVSMNP